MKACPYRKDFYDKLGSPPEKVQSELHRWLDALEKIVRQLQDFYTWVEAHLSLKLKITDRKSSRHFLTI